MGQTDDKSPKQLYERASYFKRLAIGAADPKFSAKLQPLVDEYESKAARSMLEAESAASTEIAGSGAMQAKRTG